MLYAKAPLALVVENHQPTAERYAEWLTFSGFRIAMAATVEEGWKKTLSLQPQIIATAVRLNRRGVDGCELCQRLKADDRTRTIPVIAVTPTALSGNLARARKAGCDSVLIKPCHPEDLLGEIRRLLQLPESINKTGLVERRRQPRPSQGDRVAWAVTTGDGQIIQASDAIGLILNVGSRYLVGRNIYVFFEDRRMYLRATVEHSTEEYGVEEDLWIRPRERKRTPVHITVERRDDPGLLFWVISLKEP